MDRIFVNPAIKRALCREVDRRPRLAAPHPSLVRARLPFPCPPGVPARRIAVPEPSAAAARRRMRDRARLVVHPGGQASATDPAGQAAADRRHAACLRRSGPAATIGERRVRGSAAAGLLVRQLRDGGGTCLRELPARRRLMLASRRTPAPETLPGGAAAREGGDMKPFGQGLAIAGLSLLALVAAGPADAQKSGGVLKMRAFRQPGQHVDPRGIDRAPRCSR